MPHRSASKHHRADPATALLRRNLAEALSCLANTGKIDARVHAARKAIKRARAALRLMRAALKPAVYERENRALRDAARCLSPLRDAKSLVIVCELLGKSHSMAAGGAATISALDRRLVQRLDAARGAFAESAERRRCALLVKASCRRVLPHAPRRADAAKLLAGLRRIYRSGRRAHACALAERTPQSLHEWRKQTKYLHAAAGALCDAGVQPLKRLVQRCADIAQWLGDDHDLNALRQEIGHAFPGRPGTGAIVSRIDARRRKLQRQALDRGAVVFRKKPAKFIADLSASRL